MERGTNSRRASSQDPGPTGLHTVADHSPAALQDLLLRLPLIPQLQIQKLLQLLWLPPLADLGGEAGDSGGAEAPH